MGNNMAGHCEYCGEPLNPNGLSWHRDDCPTKASGDEFIKMPTRKDSIMFGGAEFVRLADAAALIDRLVRVMRASEWEAIDEDAAAYCVHCNGYTDSVNLPDPGKSPRGHQPGCVFSDALAAVKEWREGRNG